MATPELVKETKELQGLNNKQTIDTALLLSNACYRIGFRYNDGRLFMPIGNENDVIKFNAKGK